MASEEGADRASDRSVIRECYWVVCGQFSGSEEDADAIKSAFITIGIATGTLSFVAAVSAFFASSANWPVVIGLSVLGLGALLFAWFTGLHRLDRILIATGG